jgi:hypothetical protein
MAYQLVVTDRAARLALQQLRAAARNLRKYAGGTAPVLGPANRAAVQLISRAADRAAYDLEELTTERDGL